LQSTHDAVRDEGKGILEINNFLQPIQYQRKDFTGQIGILVAIFNAQFTLYNRKC
jgi:hypothetical protein